MKPSEQRILAQLQAELSRVVRYDDESIVHDKWIRQRYDGGAFASFAPARAAAVQTAWHEAGHAVAALAVGARFNSASIHHSASSHGRGSQGRVHGITGAAELTFVVDAAGQIAERLMNWTMLDSDEDLRAWLAAWRSDGGDARRFRRAISERFGQDELGAWRYSEKLLTSQRLKVRQVARALLVHPRHLTYGVVAEIAAAS
ncbi:MAG TPA: hypothetical protein VMV07_14835 [Streptosporangiaceae bacterium]|nr:hypothetical protein [Streptosporangiaceae bacterium]